VQTSIILSVEIFIIVKDEKPIVLIKTETQRCLFAKKILNVSLYKLSLILIVHAEARRIFENNFSIRNLQKHFFFFVNYSIQVNMIERWVAFNY
jgi:hypothetical protein